MSVNQSRGDKNELPHHRRSGRSGNPPSPRNFSGGGGGGRGAGGGGTTAPPSAAFYSGKSFKKVVATAPGAQNGSNVQPPLRGTPDTSSIGATVKSADASVQKSAPGLPKAPQSNMVPPGSGTTGPSTPVKGPADASKAFPLQFGSISPGVINGMQVPARTASAPPNMDEQKRAQAHLDPSKAISFQNQAVLKQNLPGKDPGPVNHPGEVHSVPKKDMHSSPPRPVAAHPQKPSGPSFPAMPTGVSMQMPFHQPQIHRPFGSPNPPMQPQSIAANTMPLPMHLPVGNPPPQVSGPPPFFVPGIQHHQGIIHQSQSLTFSSQMNPQLGNMGGMGMGLAPQYQQQQPMGNVNFGGSRRTVKITHPDTHEELRLDKRNEGYLNGGPSGQRSHMLQSQAFPPATQQLNYYSNSYNGSALFPQPPGSNPLTSSQAGPGSQPPKFYNQASKPVTVKQPVISSHAEKVVGSMDKSQRVGGEGQPHKDPETVAESLTNSAASAVEAEVPKKTTVSKSGSIKEEPKQPEQKAQSVVTTDKVGGKLSSVSRDSGVLETPKLPTSSEISDDVSKEQVKESVEGSSNVADVAASKYDNDEQDHNSNVNVTSSGNDAPKVEESAMESKEQVKESADLDQASTALNITVNNIDDKKDEGLSKSDVDQVNSRESVPVPVSVPETSPLTLEIEATGLISPSSSSSRAKGKCPS